MTQSFEKKILNNLFHLGIDLKKKKIVVGISGGPDSTALALLLTGLQKKHSLQLLLVHINYHLRGKDSDKDQQIVEKFAQKNQLKLKIIHYKDQAKKSENLEQKLRNFRYEQFEKIRQKRKFHYIATGHTMDDQVETFLMNLIRGSGLSGLSAMKILRNHIIRPFLAFGKNELLEYLKAKKQTFRIDKSNLDPKLLRNRIRLQLIPTLEKDYNPAIKSRIYDLTAHLSDTLKIVDKNVKKFYNKVVAREDKTMIEMDLKEINRLDEDVLKLVIREAVKNLKGDLRDFGSSHFFEVKKMLASQKSKIQQISLGNLSFKKKSAFLIIKIK